MMHSTLSSNNQLLDHQYSHIHHDDKKQQQEGMLTKVDIAKTSTTTGGVLTTSNCVDDAATCANDHQEHMNNPIHPKPEDYPLLHQQEHSNVVFKGVVDEFSSKTPNVHEEYPKTQLLHFNNFNHHVMASTQHPSIVPPPLLLKEQQHFENNHTDVLTPLSYSSSGIRNADSQDMPLSIQVGKQHYDGSASTHASLLCIEPQFTLYEPTLDPLVCMSIFKSHNKLFVNNTPQMSHKHPIETIDTTFVQSKKIFETPSLYPPLSTNYETNNVDTRLHHNTEHNQQHVFPSSSTFPTVPSLSSLASSSASSSTHIHHPPNASINLQNIQNGANSRVHASVQPSSPLMNTPFNVASPSMATFPTSNPTSRIALATDNLKQKNEITQSPLFAHASSSSLNSYTQDGFSQQKKQYKKLEIETGKKAATPVQQVNLYEEDSSSPLHNEEDSDEIIEDVTLEETMMRCSPYKKITTTETGDVQINHGTWSKEEHEMFLLGLKEAGRNWELIANKYIKSRVRSQVASHAQKYFKKIEKQKKMKLLKAKEALNPSLVWSYYDYSKKN